MSGPVLGIDLGTTNSVVAIAEGAGVRVLRDGEGNSLVPSVVSFHPNGSVLVGYPARERRLLDAKNTIYSVKRLIGRPFASDEVTRARERLYLCRPLRRELRGREIPTVPSRFLEGLDENVLELIERDSAQPVSVEETSANAASLLAMLKGM